MLCVVRDKASQYIHPVVRDFGACLAAAIEPTSSLRVAFRADSVRISPPSSEFPLVTLYLFLRAVRRSPLIFRHGFPPRSDSQSIPPEFPPLSILLCRVVSAQLGATGVRVSALTASGIPSRLPSTFTSPMVSVGYRSSLSASALNTFQSEKRGAVLRARARLDLPLGITR